MKPFLSTVWGHTVRVLLAVGDYLVRVLLAVDQLANVVFFNGSPDETMSAASYRMHRDGRFWGFLMYPINWLFFWQGPNHCYNAYIKELKRTQYPEEYRSKQ